jgi:hypothetical protein
MCCFLLILGAAAGLQSIARNWLDALWRQHSPASVATQLQAIAAEELLWVGALAIIAACALGSITQLSQQRNVRRLLLASIGVAVFLGIRVQAFLALHDPAVQHLASGEPSLGLQIEVWISGVLVAALGGLLGGWLRPKLLVWLAPLSQESSDRQHSAP